MLSKGFEIVVLVALILGLAANTILLGALIWGTIVFPPGIVLTLPAGILFGITEVFLLIALIIWIAWMLIPKP